MVHDIVAFMGMKVVLNVMLLVHFSHIKTGYNFRQNLRLPTVHRRVRGRVRRGTEIEEHQITYMGICKKV